MKRFALSSLSVLVLATAIPAAHAQVTPPTNITPIGAAVRPFELVSLAYQGFLESAGIPRFNRLIFDYQAGRVTAEDLVRAAIETRRLPPDTLTNRSYLTAVDRQLNSLYGSSNR